MGTKNQRAVYETFRMIRYMNGSVFSKARYMNGVGFEILARTFVPKLPPSYPPEKICFIHTITDLLNMLGSLTELTHFSLAVPKWTAKLCFSRSDAKELGLHCLY